MDRLSRIQSAAERTAKMILAGRPTKVVVAGDGASFNWQTNTLSVPAWNREPDEPRLRSAWRGLLDHECGHVLYSDFRAADAWIAKATLAHGRDFPRVQMLWNVFEDIYMERHMMARFPGSARNIAIKRDYLHERTGGAQVTAPDFIAEKASAPIGELGALAQAILRTGGGMMTEDQIDPRTREAFDLCRAEIEAGYAATSTQDCIDAAEALWRRLKAAEEEPPPSPPESGDGAEAESGPGDDGPSQPGDESGAGEEPDDGGSAGPGDGDEGDEPGEPGDASGKGTADPGEPGAGEDDGAGSEPTPGDGAEGAQEPTGEAGEGQGESGTAPGGESPEDGTSAPEASSDSGDGDGEETGPRLGLEFVRGACHGDYTDIGPLEGYLRADAASAVGTVYTVQPHAKAADTVTVSKGSASDYADIKRAAGVHGRRLAAYLEGAFAASRQTVRVGGMEDGEWLDDDALPHLALGTERHRVFAEDFRGIEESTFVVVLIDCSGSMGSSEMSEMSKAAHAARTACVLHEALRACRVDHAVLGFTTGSVPRRHKTEGVHYSRWSTSHVGYIFVSAPGNSRGDGISEISGQCGNLDGESVQWAAEYACSQAPDADRIILIVVSDGSPAGADDGTDGQHLVETVERVARAQIEVYGVGIKTDEVDMRRYYPDRKATPGRAPTGHVIIGPDGLEDTVLRGLANLITRGYGTSRKAGLVA